MFDNDLKDLAYMQEIAELKEELKGLKNKIKLLENELEKKYKEGYEDGQHNEFIKQYLDSKIEALEEQIEKMKNCGNCKFYNFNKCKVNENNIYGVCDMWEAE